jgi:hypothetical protein
MPVRDGNNRRSRKKFGPIWGELDYLCRQVHHRMFVRRDKEFALSLLGRLERILSELPEGDLAIMRQEGLALYHHLKGEVSLAIEHRKREIELAELLQKDVRESVSNGRYRPGTAANVLGRWTADGVAERRMILES